MELKEKKILIIDNNPSSGEWLYNKLTSFNYLLFPICQTQEIARQTISLGKTLLAIIKVHLSSQWEGIHIAKYLRDNFNIESLLVVDRINEYLIDKISNLKHLGIVLYPYNIEKISSIIRDLLYRETITNHLKQQKKLVECLLKTDSEAVLLIGHNQRILATNEQFLTLNKSKNQPTIGHLLQEVVILRTEEEHLIEFDENFYYFLNQKQLVVQDIYLTSPLHNQKIPIQASFMNIDIQPIKLIIRLKDLSIEKSLKNQVNFYQNHNSETNLLNHQAFLKELKNLIKNKNYSSIHALMYIDIDHFTTLSENLGNQTQFFLNDIVRIFKDLLPGHQSHIISNLGSDKFIIAITETNTYRSLEFGWNIQKNISKIDLTTYEATIRDLSLSIGIVHFNSMEENLFSLITKAQRACFVAKTQGGNQIKIFEPEERIFKDHQSKLFWITSLTKALENDFFGLFYQDIVPLKEGLKPKIEILLRFYNQEGLPLSPQEFILIAESSGLMPKIDKWVIKNALRQYHKFNSEKTEHHIFSINISSVTVREGDIIDFIVNEIGKNNVPHSMVFFEITETALIENIQIVKNFVTKLKEVGISCSLDDFGNGYTSFSSLKELPVDVLKIDGLFIKNILTDNVSQAVVTALRQLTEAMNITLVAEFIENKEVLEVIKNSGTDYGQGYYWGPPKPLV